MGVVVRRYIDILTIIINFPYSTCISSFWGSSIPTSLFIFKMFFQSCLYNYSEGGPSHSYINMHYLFHYALFISLLIKKRNSVRHWYILLQ